MSFHRVLFYTNVLASKIIKRNERRLFKRKALTGSDIPREDIKFSRWCTLPYVEVISEKLGRIMSRSDVNVSFSNIKILNRWFQRSKIRFHLEIGLEHTD